MYIRVPKNYSGNAITAQNGRQVPDPRFADPLVSPVSVPPTEPPVREVHHTLPASAEESDTTSPAPPPQAAPREDQKREKKPLNAFLDAVRKRQENGISGDDLLLMGLISLLAGKEENRDIVGILTLLLLM